MGSVLDFLGSARLALTLVLLLTGFLLAVAVTGREALASPWFAGVLIAFTVNVAVCTARRVARLLREDGRQGVTPAPAVAADPRRDKLLATAVPVLAGQGYRVALQPNEVVAEKHRFARWGPVLLHFGFLVVLAGVSASVALRTEGHFRVVEGQPFASPAGQYLAFKRGVRAANPPRFTVYLDKVRVSKYTEGAVVAGELLFLEEGRPLHQATVETGRPAAYRSLTFHKEIFGYAVGVILRDSGGKIYPLRVGLETVVYPGGEKYAGRLQVPGTPYRMKVEFFPTLGGTPKAPRTASYEPRDPAVFVKIEERHGDRNVTVYEGVLRLGQSAKTQGYEARFDHYRQWLGMTVVSDPGRPVIWAGSALVVSGLFLTYLVFPRRVRVSVAANGAFTVKGWAPRFGPLIAEEVERLRQEIKRQTKLEVYDARD